MKYRQPSALSLVSAAAVVVVALAALVVLPLFMSNRMMSLRASLRGHADPARAALHEVSSRTGEQIAALTRAFSTGDARYVGKYRGYIEPQQEAFAALERHRGQLGPQYDEALDELRQRLTIWHRSVEQSVSLQSLVFESNYTRVVESIRSLEQAITQYQNERREEIEALARTQVWMTTILVLIAATAAGIVLWMVFGLRNLTAALQREAAAREAALERQQQLVRDREQILGVVSHDLRSPLTTIALSTDMIPDSSPDEQREHLNTILTTTRRMERLIQDLLDVTRLEHGKLTIHDDLVDVNDVVEEAVGSHRSIAASKAIRLETEADADVPKIRGDGDRLAQTLDNLIGNAFKFTPAGGTVRLQVANRNGAVRFEVSDTGPGIDSADMPHLFEPFWQGKDNAELGAGIGLKIARGIVEAHGGTMEVTNNEQGGATFAFELPAAEKT